jgi:hypothetical protein
MAEYTDAQGIRCFEPDDTNDTFYLPYASSMEDIFDRAKEKFGLCIKMDQVTISVEHIHTRCLGYDAYDGADWTDYIVVTKS